MLWIASYILNRILNIVLAVIAFFLVLRIVFRFLSANPSTPFVRWIYNISNILLTPFQGIFPNQSIGNGAVFDVVALITLVAYAVLLYLLSAIIKGILRSDRFFHHDYSEHAI